MKRTLTAPQQRLLDTIRREGPGVEYWPVMNDWVKDRGPAARLALHNINRTVKALLDGGHIRIDDDGLIWLVDEAA